MSTVGQWEILTQKRVIAFFKDALDYAYLLRAIHASICTSGWCGTGHTAVRADARRTPIRLSCLQWFYPVSLVNRFLT